jgi:hypothetical protein
MVVGIENGMTDISQCFVDVFKKRLIIPWPFKEDNMSADDVTI